VSKKKGETKVSCKEKEKEENGKGREDSGKK